MASTTPTTSIRLRRLVPAVLFAAATALGASTLANPAVASAAPREWDIGAYDECMRQLPSGMVKRLNKIYSCCIDSGGVWDANQSKCVALE